MEQLCAVKLAPGTGRRWYEPCRLTSDDETGSRSGMEVAVEPMVSAGAMFSGVWK